VKVVNIIGQVVVVITTVVKLAVGKISSDVGVTRVLLSVLLHLDDTVETVK